MRTTREGEPRGADEECCEVESKGPQHPPEWHGTVVDPVEFRSLMHDTCALVEHNHEQAELILHFGSSSGEIAWWDTNGAPQSASLAAEQCCLIPAGVRHAVHGLHVEGVVSLLIGGALLAEVMRKNVSQVLVESLRNLTARDIVTGGLIAEFAYLVGRQSQAYLLNAVGLAASLKLLHAILYRKSKYSLASFPSLSTIEQKRVSEYLVAHLADYLDVDSMARHMAMSRTHFARRFRATFGVSPLQYVLRMRVDHALGLLRGGEYRVAEAAHASGFCDQSHFDRHCRKFYGRPPTALLNL